MAEYVSPLLQLVPLLLGQLEKEFRVLADAENKLKSLRDSIGVIERFLKKVNSVEVITEDLKASVQRARKILYIFENAIDDFSRCENHRGWEGFFSFLYRHYRRRTFVPEAGHILPMVDDYMTMERDAVMEALRGLSGNDAQSGSASHLSSSIAYSEEGDEDLVAIAQSKDYLFELLNSAVLIVIFVHGPRGVGKTSLVGAVLRDKNVKKLFKYYVWIEDLRSSELSAAALMEANTKVWRLSMVEGKEDENLQDHKLKEAFRLMEEDNDLKARTGRWALVMDDASRADVLKSLRRHLDRTRPSILVTTRVRSLHSSSRHFFTSLKYAPYDFKRVLLTKEESQSLIEKNIHGDFSNRIWEKSEGLPLEILATCDLLNCQRPSVTGAPDGVKWKKLSGRLGEALQSNGHEGGRIRRMRAPRMDPLLDVRACLLYLSVFPLESSIRCSTMMRLWMAERLIEHKGAQTVQEKAEETMEKLLDHYEILEKETTSYGRVKTCGVPPVRHQQLISESIDEEFAMIVDRQERGWPENVWHLSFQRDMDSTYDDTWIEELRSLLVFKKVYLPSLKSVLEKAKRLKVLHLQSLLTHEENKDPRPLMTFPPQILQLKYLRYLSLRDTQVSHIPSEIKDLSYLETLDLRGTLVSVLPKNLELKALRHLLVSNIVPVAPVESAPLKIVRLYKSCKKSLKVLLSYTNKKLGVKPPSKLGNLTSLQKLCMIEVEPVGRIEWLKELGKLTNLRKLGLSMLEGTDWEPLCSSIEKLTNLEALHLIGDERQKMELAKTDKRKAPEYLHRVHLIGRLENLPGWILPRDSLVKLVLKGSQLKEDPLSHLANFSCLKHLELEDAFDFKHMEFDRGQFEKLCFLGLNNFANLKSIKDTSKALPSLERLRIARCEKLESVPDFITERIKHLEFCEMHSKFKKWAEEFRREKDMKGEILTWIAPTREVPFKKKTRNSSRGKCGWRKEEGSSFGELLQKSSS